MRIAVTGASGRVGLGLVPELRRRNVELLLVGRDPDRLSGMFPGSETCAYEALGARLKGCDAVIHLAVANNDARLPEQAFHDVNVTLLVGSAAAAAAGGVPLFVNVSSVHALDEGNTGAYARSKRAGSKALESVEGIRVHTLYLPYVYGDTWDNRLAFMNRIPRWAGRAAFAVLSALKPTVHLRTVAAHIVDRLPVSGESAVILHEDQDGNPVFGFVKRAIDLCFALAVVILFGWLLALLWLGVRLTSPGPGIFAQERVGRHGAPFTCYKFRTMRTGTIQKGTHEVGPSAVTAIGRILRKTKLDELPQVWNILRNEVSLVGPRPSLPSQEAVIRERSRRDVFAVKPGITGLSQVRDIDMSQPVSLSRTDARYVALRSILLELKILVHTFAGKGQGDRTKIGTETS